MLFIILFIILIFIIVFAITINQYKTGSSNKTGGGDDEEIDKLIQESIDADAKLDESIGKLDESISDSSKSGKKIETIQPENKLESDFSNIILFDDNNIPFEKSETEKIRNFIENNDVTYFISSKNKKYSLNELLHFLKIGNLPQGTIYTTTNNKYVYK
jgi:hypothetical protein